MHIPYYSDEELQKIIEEQAFDITKEIEFILIDINQKFSQKSNNPMWEVELQIASKPEWYPLKDYLLYESTAGLHIMKFKRFMQSIGLQELHKTGQISISDILSKTRIGKFKLEEQENEYTDKNTGQLVKGKRRVVKEYIINPVQEKFQEFNDGIPF